MKVKFYPNEQKVSARFTKIGDISVSLGEAGNVIIRGIELCETEGKKWLKMPCRKYTKDGETCYYNFATFDKEFTKAILDEAIKQIPVDDLPL